MFFWNSLAFSIIQWMLVIWSLVPLCFFSIQLEHLEVHGSHTVKALLGEFWALLYECVRCMQLCGSLNILWHCLSLGLAWKLFPVLWPLLSFPNLLAYWVQHFDSSHSDLHEMVPHCGFHLHFSDNEWTSGSSWFKYCWSLAWRILSITLLVCEMSAIVW